MLYKSIVFIGMLILGMLPLVASAMPSSHVDKSHPGQLHGIVKDQNQEPVIGANVYWKGTQTGAVTDENGAFLLPVSDKTRSLIVSYIGYDSYETEVVDPSVCLDVTL
ncbi:MAG: carboxypeptidase-like regulatory domain-containing protein, partial [Bacteroidales bacterium]